MEFKYLEKCGEACQRGIGIALITFIALVSLGGLLLVFISIARSGI